MGTPECYYCKAKEHCIAAAQPGSVVCMVNRMRYGGTHAMTLRREQKRCIASFADSR